MTVAEAKESWPQVYLPKVPCCEDSGILNYLEHGGKKALITNPENIGRALKGETVPGSLSNMSY
jgi:carbamate kinase